MSNELAILSQLESQGNLRRLLDMRARAGEIVFDGKSYVNLSSNDYLGISHRVDLQDEFFAMLSSDMFYMSGSSSRLMCGNSNHYTELEEYIADFYKAQASLVLGSGYLLNSSILRAITDKGDVILADKLIHASLVDGLKLAECEWERFRHNDVENLEKLLIKHSGKNVVVVIETVYSMDGDIAPVDEILRLKKRYNFVLVADEAHAFGVLGEQGCGVIDINCDVDYRIVTLGKAAASTGAFVVCNSERKSLLVNRLKGLIYSTALPVINILWTKFIIEKIRSMDSQRNHLKRLIELMGAQSHIFPIMCSGNEAVLKLSENLKNEGFWVTAIRYPTVSRGSERIRVSLNAALEVEQLEKLCKLIG